ncbi:unnamed protein product [Caenorhabditis angaria]|uniref:Uncharacterized protein n=1 Tax=Caenorhabditis angaria TaxID=860376 RepID=A0A9P1IDY4_9PELO|nr:unnamed protein product [Caenorhabditis angaria]
MDDSYAIATPNNEIYNQLYAEFNPQGLPRIGAAEAANFLKKSNLPMPSLGQIWELSDSTKQGSLDKRGAFVAFKLVAAAQQGKQISNSALYDGSIAPPKFGAPIPPINQQHHFQPSFPSVGRAPPIPPAPHNHISHSPIHNGFPANWPITEADQNKYDSIFQSLNPINGKLSGASVRPVLINSGLDPVSLARIWELSDQDKDGCLDRIEMTIALHLVYRALQSEPIPAQLPPNLIHPSKVGLPQSTLPYAPRPSLGSRAGSVTSLDEVNMHSSLHRAAPPPPRAHSAVHYNGSGASTPVSASFPVSPSHGSLNTSWPVNTSEFAAQFSQCDTNSDGLVDGQDIRAPLLSTGLNAPILAQIWALVDIKKCGQLNLEQFSLCMYLIELAKRGEIVPNELPIHLIPPSFREHAPLVNNRSIPTNQGVSVSTPQLAEATSMEIKEALEGDNEEMKQLAESIQTMLIDRTKIEENVLQLETDMDAKNSRIKNLQIELQTLESTVKQLERQKTEATRRLNDYDNQIQQLEAACQAQREKKEETEKRMKQIEEDSKNAEESANVDQKEMEELRKEIAELEISQNSIRAEIQKRRI